MAKKGKKGGGAGGGGKNKGNNEQKREKVIADKTFGMKNKGGKKAQAIKQGMRNAAMSTKQSKAEASRREQLKQEKIARRQAQKEKARIDAMTARRSGGLPPGVDPKTIICEFFKQGTCRKGKKCRFSHDWSQVKATEKIDIYTDPRAGTESAPAADAIPCKHFIEAVEKQQYGYFWTCPNTGAKCQYAHCLPEGFVLKTDKEKAQADENKDDEETLEDAMDRMRGELAGRTDLTPCTLENFKKWKANKKQKASDERRERAEKMQKQKAREQDKTSRFLSGRDLFTYDPSVFVDDADADDEQYIIQSDNEDGGDDNATTSNGDSSKPPTKPSSVDDSSSHTTVTSKKSADPSAEATSGKKKKKKSKKQSKKEEPPSKNGVVVNGVAPPPPSSTSPSGGKEPPDSTQAADLAIVGDESLFLDDDLLDVDLSDE